MITSFNSFPKKKFHPEMNTNNHEFHPGILREYDIRGIVGDTLSTADAYAIGRTFASIIGESAASPRIATGFDGRLSSPELESELVRGLTDAGADVVRIGLGPTPMLYYTVHTLDLDGGIMVTGSHNPPDYNGFKLMRGKAGFFGADIIEFGKRSANGDWLARDGLSNHHDVSESYLDCLLQDYTSDVSFKIAWDAGNGATGDMLVRLTERLPGTHTLINTEIDGTFPAHHPDPTVPANLVQLQDAVAAGGLDLGIAFDGDGDRIGVVDGNGEILWADQLLALFARDVLTQFPGATIVADVKSSRILFDEIARLGGNPLMWKTGHSLIKSKMAEVNAPLAGEQSAHIFFADHYYGFDDALYVAVRLLDFIALSGQSLAELRSELPSVLNTPELRFPCPAERKLAVIEEVRARLDKAGADVNVIDGVRVSSDEGWWLLRASNTQDVLVARVEASSQAGLDRLKGELSDQIKASGLAPPSI